MSKRVNNKKHAPRRYRRQQDRTAIRGNCQPTGQRGLDFQTKTEHETLMDKLRRAAGA